MVRCPRTSRAAFADASSAGLPRVAGSAPILGSQGFDEARELGAAAPLDGLLDGRMAEHVSSTRRRRRRQR